MPPATIKRNYQTMVDSHPIDMDGISYHDLTHAYYSPTAPPQTMLFSQSFISPDGGYAPDVYNPTTEFYPGHQALLDSYNQPDDSFCSVSNSSSCNTSLSAVSPPPLPMKYPAVAISPSHMLPRSKAKRTATACEECRKRKQKCDGASPCQSCKEQHLECKYREVTPTKKDTSMERLVHLVEHCSQSMDALNQRLDTMNTAIRTIERRLSHCWQCGSAVELETGFCESCARVACR